MGCWYKTCGLSNLPIRGGEGVYVFPIEKNLYEHDRSYTDSLWSPCLIPFECEYDDYGAGENCSGSSLNYIMNALRESIDFSKTTVSSGEVVEDFTVEQFFESSRTGHLYLKHPKKPTQVDYVMIRKDVVLELMKSYTFELYVGRGKGTTGYDDAYIEFKYQEVYDRIGLISTLLIEQFRKDKFHYLPFVWRAMESSDPIDRYVVTRICQSESRKNGFLHNRILEEAVKSDDLCDVIRYYLIGIFVDTMMYDIRKVWIPACHEGSQSLEMDKYLLMNSVVNKIIQEDEEDEE